LGTVFAFNRDALNKSKIVDFTKPRKYFHPVPARAGRCRLPAYDGFVKSPILDLIRGFLAYFFARPQLMATEHKSLLKPKRNFYLLFLYQCLTNIRLTACLRVFCRLNEAILKCSSSLLKPGFNKLKKLGLLGLG
jgi:hypothetical protein